MIHLVAAVEMCSIVLFPFPYLLISQPLLILLVDIAWDLLMKPQYAALRSCIYSTEAELSRFRQLIVNAVMAVSFQAKIC